MHAPTPSRHDQPQDLLRFLTCGSVDDGKSTLIGRLLYDTKLVPDDHVDALARDSKPGAGLDFSLLVDGLQAEREQGITIDVAYRFFATEKRSFIVADTPGHEQYTRNMATGASTADLAILLVDARLGLLTQTRRHSHICSLLGIPEVVLAVNKMDLIGYDQGTFEQLAAEYRTFAEGLGFEAVHCIPVSALSGDNIAEKSEMMGWYRGPTLLHLLEAAPARAQRHDEPFRMPVQMVQRPNADFRGYAGRIASGVIRPGDAIRVWPSGKQASVTRIVTMNGDLAAAGTGQSVTLTLDREIDISRGDLITAASLEPEVSDQVSAHLVWMHDHALIPHRQYIFRIGTTQVGGQVTDLRYGINVDNQDHIALKTLHLNEIGSVHIGFDRPIAFSPYDQSRETGGLIMIDRETNATVGAGMIRFALRRATNIAWQSFEVSKSARARIKGQKPAVLWFTGLSGSGKSTIANLVEKRLHAMGAHTISLDGDNVRHGLNRDLGFTEEDRAENIRRIAETARLMSEAGLISLVSFISPFRTEREMARELMDEGEFIEIWVNTPLAVCEARDVKGLYAKARAGKLANFTGIDSPYEEPHAPELELAGASEPPDLLAEKVVTLLQDRGLIR